MRVVIIGGGIAGLSAAYYLDQKASQEGKSLEISLIEASDRLGGKIITDRVGEFVVEGGPDTFLATKPWAAALCRELGLESRLEGTNPRHKRTFVLHKGRLQSLPDGLTMMIPTRFSPMIRTGLLSWPEKIRMGMDFFLPPRPLDGDESLGEFVSRRLGRAAYERLIEPLMSGIYAGDGDQLSLQSTFPYLRELELSQGGLVKGALQARRKLAEKGQKAVGSRSAFLTPRTGLAEIVESLAAVLKGRPGVEMRLSSPARRVYPENPGFRVELSNGEILEAEAVVLGVPAYVSGSLLEEAAPDLGRDLQDIPYISTATISLGYRLADLSQPLDGYGYVIPRREGRRALACTWTSTKFPHRAPEGYALLRVFAGRAGEQDDLPQDPEALLALAKEELRQTMGITAEPVLHKTFYWDRAMPQYNLGHPERLKRIDQALENLPGLALAGNGYRGIGIPDCIHSGATAAEKIFTGLFAGEAVPAR